MAYASEILARVYEECNGPHPEMKDRELIKKFITMEKKLGLLNMLRGLNEINTEVSDKKNVILIFSDTGDLESKTYRSTTEALRALFELEIENPKYDIVLVKADTSEEVRFAFKNYFSDTKDFVNLVEKACSTLSGKEIVL